MTHQDNVPLAKMSAAQMEKHLFNLKFASKQLMRDSKKADKEEKAEKKKLQKAIEKGNMDVARIHAENAIRQKNQSLNYLRMSARIDAVASRVQTAVTTKRVTSSMQGVVKAMDSAMKSMNLEKVRKREFQLILSLSSLGPSYHACAYFQISGLMDKFEKEFEDLDVQTSVMENTMGERNVFGPSVCSVSDIPTFSGNTTATNVPQDAVEGLMKQAADEAGLELNMELPGAVSNTIGTTVANSDQDELSQRLARLRQSTS